MTTIAFSPEQEFQRAIRGRRMLTLLMVFAIVMFFAGLTSAYVVSQGSAEYWVNFSLPTAFWYSTAFIIGGSITVQAALMMAKAGKQSLVAPLLFVTLVLGIGFGYYQFKGWTQLASMGNVLSFSNVLQPTGEYGKDYTVMANNSPLVKQGGEYFAQDDVTFGTPLNADMAEQVNGASQYFYILTGSHFAHAAFGLLSLVVMLVMALQKRYTPQNHVGLWAGAVYWHFLGGLWIYLLLFLQFVH